LKGFSPESSLKIAISSRIEAIDRLSMPKRILFRRG
jgi:hypothetical protein